MLRKTSLQDATAASGQRKLTAFFGAGPRVPQSAVASSSSSSLPSSSPSITGSDASTSSPTTGVLSADTAPPSTPPSSRPSSSLLPVSTVFSPVVNDVTPLSQLSQLSNDMDSSANTMTDIGYGQSAQLIPFLPFQSDDEDGNKAEDLSDSEICLELDDTILPPTPSKASPSSDSTTTRF